MPETFDEHIVECAASLDGILAEGPNRILAHFARDLHQSAAGLAEEPSPKTMASVLSSFLTLLHNYREAMRNEPGCIFWRLAAQYGDVADNLTGPSPAENQSFESLPQMLASLPWVTEFLVRLSRAARLSAAQEDELAAFSARLANRLLRRAEQSPEGAFLAQALRIQRGLENRMRQVWLVGQLENGEPGPLELYATAHRCLFPAFQPSLASTRVEQEIQRLKNLADALELAEIALCFEGPEWLAQYSLVHFMPPDPSAWAPRFLVHYDRLLFGRVSRWYTYPFLHVLSPMEITATVLRMGRPLFYERAAAHALLEYALLQDVAFDSSRLGHYLDTIRVLDYQFRLFFEGYLLRLAFYPKLKEPRGWCEYLDALQRLHQGELPLPELHAYRREFLRARGLSGAEELLCRLSGSQGPLQ